MFKGLEPVPNLKMCSSLFNIPADELLICDENIVQLLINGDVSDLEEFKPFKHIILQEHPLSQTLFEQLLREHGATIETLEVTDCPAITDLKGNMLSNLTSLSVIPFSEVTTSDMKGISNIREALQKNAARLETLILDIFYLDETILNDILSLTRLKKLSLFYYPNPNECMLGNISFRELEELTLKNGDPYPSFLEALLNRAPGLKRLDLSNTSFTFNAIFLSELEVLNLSESTIDTNSLQTLLQRSTKLKNIDLSRCPNLGEDLFGELSLSQLEVLNLSNCAINITSLQALFQRSTKLKYIDLSHCTNLSEGLLSGIVPSQLEVLNLSRSTISAASLKALLQGAPNLKILDLYFYRNLNEDSFSGISLTQLESVQLNTSTITILSLQALLQGAPKLKKIILAGCSNLDEGTLHGISLNELEELNLHSTNFNAASLQALLQGAPNIKNLVLARCKNLGYDTFYGMSFRELEVLDLTLSNVDVRLLQTLLQGAPKIKKIDLTCCQRISDLEFDVLVKQYPAIEFTRNPYARWARRGNSNKFIRYYNHEGPKITPSVPTQDQQQARPLDANTDVEKKTYQLEREFIAEPLPDVRMMRHECYQRMALNPAMTDRADPFLLINEEPHPVEGTILNAVKSAVPLIDAFKETTKTQSFTRLD
ncbi:MAG: hypothetical protein Q8M03_08265, partial [Legionella sp.]|nr:hypothetical protein [Legionella sp.]